MSQEFQYPPSHPPSVSNDGSFASDREALLTNNRPATQRNGKVLRILLLGLAIPLSIFLLASGILIRILAVNDFSIKSDSLETTASIGPTIAIAHLCSVLITATVPLVLGLAAYNLSRDWLAASRIGGENRPTPFQ
jgi:hypothetical protein